MKKNSFSKSFLLSILFSLIVIGIVRPSVAQDGEPIKTMTPGGISDDWVKWNKDTCQFEAVDAPADTWVGTIRKQEPPFKLGYTNQSETLSPLLTIMTDNLKANLEAAGIELIYGNNDFPSTTTPITAAQTIVLQKPDVVVSFNVLSAIMEAVNKNYHDACIPVIQVEATAPNTVFFGASNVVAGNVAGGYLGDYAVKQGWNPAEVTILGARQPNIGPSLDERITSCQNAAQAKLPGSKIDEFNAGDGTATAQTAMTDWLTAHPNDHHVVVCTMADIFAIGIANAFEGAGRTADGAVMGMLATPDARPIIKEGKSALIASVDFKFDVYPDFFVAMAQDIYDGKPIPAEIYQALEVVDKSNVE